MKLHKLYDQELRMTMCIFSRASCHIPNNTHLANAYLSLIRPIWGGLIRFGMTRDFIFISKVGLIFITHAPFM